MYDRMPYWVNTFQVDNVLCPLMSPDALRLGASGFGAPDGDFRLHSDVIAEIMPVWADVPFYTPTGVTRRALPMLWQTEEWDEIRAVAERHADYEDRWNPDRVTDVLKAVDHGEGGKEQEVSIARLLWDVAFERYLDDLAGQVRQARTAVHAAATPIASE